MEEAAEFLASAIDEEASSSEHVGENLSWIDLEMLKSAALYGHLSTYQPGNDIRMKYDPLADSVVREYYEEVRWDDLNNWLKKFHQNIPFRFPNPDTDELKSTTKGQDKKGVEKKEILCVDWPEGKFVSNIRKRKGRIPSIENILNDLPSWVESACIKVGRRGVSSHLWNPAQLALCLVTTSSRKKWTVNKKQLTDFIADKFSDYLEEWKRLSDQL